MKLAKLAPDTRYLICVVGLANWAHRSEELDDKALSHQSGNFTGRSPSWETIGEGHPLLTDSTTTRCTEVRTLEAPGVRETRRNGNNTGSILTRRLGLIVGCCMGTVVFIILVSVLGYLKIKKQRSEAKREQPLPQEYISYRHFSIQSGEAHHHHPSGSAAVTTSLNS